MARKGLKRYGMSSGEPRFEPTNQPADQAPQQDQNVLPPEELDLIESPVPVPVPAAAPAAEEKPKEPEEPKEKAFEEERIMLFGKPSDQKMIVKFAAGGLVAAGLIYFLFTREMRPYPWVPLAFMAIHGALIGMLLGQLSFVFNHGVMWLCAGLGVAAGEGAFAAAMAARDKAFMMDKDAIQAIIALFFWGGFVGFWAGYIFYQKHLKRIAKFQLRYAQMTAENKDEPQNPAGL